MAPKHRSRLSRASLSVRVIAELRRLNMQVKHSQTRKRMNRKTALEAERREISRLLRRGYQLTNWCYNPARHRDAQAAVAAILSQAMR